MPLCSPSSSPQSVAARMGKVVSLVSTFYKEGWQWLSIAAGPGALASFAGSLTPAPPDPSLHAHQSGLSSVLFLVWSLANKCKHYIQGPLFSHEIKNTLQESIAEYLKQKNESVNWKIKMVEITSEEQNKVKRIEKN